MLKWISKSGTFIQFTIFIVLLLVFWIPAFVNPHPAVISPSDGPLYTLLVSWLQSVPFLQVAIALVIIVIQSLILFYVFQSNGLFGRSNFLPAIIVLLSFSWNVDYMTLHALLPAGIFCIIALNSIMQMYGKPAAFHQVFTAAFSLGLASLFYIPMVYFLLLIWFTLITYRVSSWREYAISIVAFSIPLIYYICWLFWIDNLLSGLNQWADSLLIFSLPPRLSLLNTAWLSLSALIMLLSLTATLNVMSDKIISLRRKAWVLFNFSITGIVVLIFSGWPLLSINYVFVIPMSFFITGSLTLIKRSFWFEVLILGYFCVFIAMRGYLLLHLNG